MTHNLKNFIVIAAVIALAFIAYAYMTTPENRTIGQKLDAAVNQLDNGVDNAARELENRTPAERAGDAIKDATDK